MSGVNFAGGAPAQRRSLERFSIDMLPTELVAAFQTLASASANFDNAKAALSALEGLSAKGAANTASEALAREEVVLRKVDLSLARETVNHLMETFEQKMKYLVSDQIVQAGKLIAEAEHVLSAIRGDEEVRSTFVYLDDDIAQFRGERVPPSPAASLLGHFVRMAKAKEV